MKLTILQRFIFSFLLVMFCVNLIKAQSSSSFECEKPETINDLSDIEKYLDVVESESKKISLIECLLKFRGNKTPYWGVAISNDVSQTFGSSPLEVIALFRISRLFYGDSDFGLAMVLVDGNEKQNSATSIKKAYRSYEKWLNKVKKIGLKEARKQNLDPLAGSGVRWYGSF